MINLVANTIFIVSLIKFRGIYMSTWYHIRRPMMTNKTAKYLNKILVKEMVKAGIIAGDGKYDISCDVCLPTAVSFVSTLPFYPAGKILVNMGFNVTDVRQAVIDSNRQV